MAAARLGQSRPSKAICNKSSCIPTISSGEIAADTDLPKAKSATEAEADKVPWKEKKWKSKSEKV